MKTVEQLQRIANSLTIEELNDACRAAGHYRSGFPYPLDSPSPLFYIKYGGGGQCFNNMEVATQVFTRDSLKAMSGSTTDGGNLPRVPKIFRVFGGRYMVMEYVQGKTLLELAETKSWEEQLQYIDRIAEAVDILLTIPIPAEAAPGPYGGGITRHPLFKDSEAPKIFNDVASLQEHINYMSTLPQKSRYTANPPRPESTFDNRLYLVYSDFYPGNFIFDANGSLWIIDFGHASLLPLCFQTYALLRPFPASGQYADAIYDRIKTELPTRNIEAMRRAAGWFGMSVRWLGLSKDEVFQGDYTPTYTFPEVMSVVKSQPDTSRSIFLEKWHSWFTEHKYTCLLLASGALGLSLALRRT
ncbi:hypothetical protein CRV24_002597 [Beauveria bassiana]|nr:hypothetical protein CRV24_002597 [Beauveria bassiana]